MKQYTQENKNIKKEYDKNYYLNNKDKIKKYQNKNKDKIKKYKKEYDENRYSNNREKLIEQNTTYIARRRKVDDLFKFKSTIRINIRESFKRKGHWKNNKTEEILGVDLDTAWEYLKNTWYKNYGTKYSGEEYHIDHIIPLAVAQTEDDVLRLCNISNLQLLTPKDNLEKSDKVEKDKEKL